MYMNYNQDEKKDEWAIQVAQDIYDTLHRQAAIFLSWGVPPGQYENHKIFRYARDNV